MSSLSTHYAAANRPAYLQGAFTNPTTKTTAATNYVGNPTSKANAHIQYWPHGAIYAYLPGNTCQCRDSDADYRHGAQES